MHKVMNIYTAIHIWISDVLEQVQQIFNIQLYKILLWSDIFLCASENVVEQFNLCPVTDFSICVV